MTAFSFFKGIAFASLLLMMCATVPLGWTRSAVALRLLCIGLLAYVLEPLLDGQTALQIAVTVLAILVPLLFWWFCLQLFVERDSRLSPWRVPALVVATLFLVFSYGSYGLRLGGDEGSTLYLAFFYPSYLLRIFFILASLVLVFLEWREDLVEERRSFRALLLGMSGLYILVVLVTELGLGLQAVPQWLETLNAIAMAVMLLAVAVWLILSNPETLLRGPVSSTRQPVKEKQQALSSREETWLREILRLLEEKKIYRENGLSIGEFAGRLTIPEHRLRRLINQQLGFRNFNDFLNHYRLTEAATRLAEKDSDETPILTIALESGFSSINPFNRAFRARFNCTPSEYRKRSGSS